jgi:hypothetical protein
MPRKAPTPYPANGEEAKSFFIKKKKFLILALEMFDR